MKKLLLILLLVSVVSFGQQSKSFETLRASSEECKSIFVDSVDSFYAEVNFLCSSDYNNFLESGVIKEYKGNTDKEENSIPFAEITKVPRFLQCYLVSQSEARECFKKQLNAHIRRNFRYPEIAQKMGIQGRVYVNFIISEDGSITNIRLRGPDKNLEKEAKRIISKLPKMTPGKQKGRPVRVPFSVPISFRLQ